MESPYKNGSSPEIDVIEVCRCLKAAGHEEAYREKMNNGSALIDVWHQLMGNQPLPTREQSQGGEERDCTFNFGGVTWGGRFTFPPEESAKQEPHALTEEEIAFPEKGLRDAMLERREWQLAQLREIKRT